jgi:hypothetical protein
LLKTAWQTLDRFARRDPKLKDKIGAHAVLHTNNRKLDYHPRVHMLVLLGQLIRRQVPGKAGKAIIYSMK